MGGNPLGLTPNFDRLASGGTYLPLCFTPQPVCGPARSCLQSGRYATETGCWKNGIPLPPEESRLAPAFRDAGYKTGYIGKWHLGRHVSRGPVVEEDRGGYQYWLAANRVEVVSDAYEARLYDNDNQEIRLPGYRADALADAAIRFVNDNQSDPFFLFLSFLEPHHQNHRDDYPAPDGYAEQYAGCWTPPDLAALGGSTSGHLPGYGGMIKRLDKCLGRLQDALKSLGLEENTVVAFISDHGCHFKTRKFRLQAKPPRGEHPRPLRPLGRPLHRLRRTIGHREPDRLAADTARYGRFTRARNHARPFLAAAEARRGHRTARGRIYPNI